MSTDTAIMFPVSFAGAIVGILGMLCAPDGLTGYVAALLFLGCAMIFGSLVIWYPEGKTPES